MADDTQDTNNQQQAPDRAPVPYGRFQSVVNSRNELNQQNEALRTEVQQLTERLAGLDSVAAELADARKRADGAEAKFSQYRSAASRGVTDSDLFDAVVWSHSRLGDDAPDLDGWLDQLIQDPSQAPSVLRPHFEKLGGQSNPEQRSQQQQQQQPATPPGRGNANSQPPSAPNPMSAAQLRVIKERAVLSGDWTEWIAATQGLRQG